MAPPYLVTVSFGEPTLLSVSLPRSFIAIDPPLSVRQYTRATSVDTVMRRWVSLSLLQLPLRFKQLPFVAHLNFCFYLFILLLQRTVYLGSPLLQL